MRRGGITVGEHVGHAKEQIDLFVDLSPEGELDVQAGTNKFDFPANWKLQLENAMDGYHPNFSHETYLDMLQKQIWVRPDVFQGNSTCQSRDLGSCHVMLEYRHYNHKYSAPIRALIPPFSSLHP